MSAESDDLDSTVSHLCAGLSVTVPVEIEVSPEAVAACRQSYESRVAMGANPKFADFLWDIITVEPTFTCNGYVLDPETGHGIREVDND
jgi:hypothetical protein